MIKGEQKKQIDDFLKNHPFGYSTIKTDNMILKEIRTTNELLKNLIGLMLIQNKSTDWNGNKGVYYGR